MTVTVVDYGRGNLFSITQALRHLGRNVHIGAAATDIATAEQIVLPGVGAFGDCMESLKFRGLDRAVKSAAARGVPILGICVGAQVMLDAGEEFGRHDGLGLVPGTVRRLPEGSGASDSIRIPNVGWRSLVPHGSSLEDLPANTMVYFVHSYAPFVDDPRDVMATIEINGTHVPAAFRRDHVMGFQFHPEKSGPVGLALIDRFVHFAR